MLLAMAVRHERKTTRRKAKPVVGDIEIEPEGVTMQVGRSADAALIAAIIHAIKASR